MTSVENIMRKISKEHVKFATKNSMLELSIIVIVGVFVHVIANTKLSQWVW